MKKIEKLQKAFHKLNEQVNQVSFERNDTSYRRSGGYFGTTPAQTSDVIIVRSYSRTKYLNTYICVNKSDCGLVEQLRIAETNLNAERERLRKIENKKWAKSSIVEATEFANKQIAGGTIHTNYVKIFIQGNTHIYGAHPHYQHSDYNKWVAMPNTPKHWKVAQELNAKMKAAGLSI